MDQHSKVILQNQTRVNGRINLRKSYIFVVFYLMGGNDAINAFLMAVRAFIVIPGNVDKLLEYTIVGVFAFFSLNEINWRFTKKELVLFFWFLFAILIGMLKESKYTHMYISITEQAIYGLIAYIYFRTIEDYEELRKCFCVLAISLSVTITMQVISVGTLSRLSYSQSLAYALLPASIISTSESFRCKSLLYIINAVYSTFLIFCMGARWPLVCVGLFFLIKSLAYWRFEKRKAALLFIVVLVFTVLIVNIDAIFIYIGKIMPQFGLSTRTLLAIQNSTFFEGNGREEIWRFSIEQIRQNPILGYGIGSDRVLISSYMGRPDLILGYYPHNIVIELLFQFGIFLGGILNILLVWTIIKSVRLSKNVTEYDDSLALDMVLIMLMIGVIPLLVSGSYLIWIPFYEYLGICYSISRKSKQRKLS